MLRASFIGFFAAVVASVGVANAANISCDCNLPARSMGEVTSVVGSVSLIRKGGAPKVQVGSQVQAGSRVVVGAGSEATVAFSRECVVTLPPNSDLIVSGGRGGLCVATRAGRIGVIAGGPAVPAAAGLGGIGTPGLLAAGAVGVGAIGAAVAIGSSNNDKRGGGTAAPVSR